MLRKTNFRFLFVFCLVSIALFMTLGEFVTVSATTSWVTKEYEDIQGTPAYTTIYVKSIGKLQITVENFGKKKIIYPELDYQAWDYGTINWYHYTGSFLGAITSIKTRIIVSGHVRRDTGWYFNPWSYKDDWGIWRNYNEWDYPLNAYPYALTAYYDGTFTMYNDGLPTVTLQNGQWADFDIYIEIKGWHADTTTPHWWTIVYPIIPQLHRVPTEFVINRHFHWRVYTASDDFGPF